MKPQNRVTAEYLFFLKSERSFYFWHLQEHAYTEVKKRGVFILMGSIVQPTQTFLSFSICSLSTEGEDLRDQESVSRVLAELLDNQEGLFDSEDDDVSTTNDYSSINEQVRPNSLIPRLSVLLFLPCVLSVSNNMTIISIAHFLHLILQMLLNLLMTVNGEDIVNIVCAVMAKHFITVHREVVYFQAYSLMQFLVFPAHRCVPSCCNRLFSPWDQ